jgi:sulfide:quinone oxidoreductase
MVGDMERSAGSSSSVHVVIAGAGIAGVETLLALRALGNEAVRVTLIAPEPTLFYRPAATAEAFADGAPRTYDVKAITADLGADYNQARLVFVGSRQRYIRLSSGIRVTYDALVLATGTRSTAGIAGAVMFRDQRDVRALRRILHEIDSQAVRRVVFAVPTGPSWPLPVYELALLLATRARERRQDTEVTLVTPEQTPLAVFGAEPSRLVEGVLAECGVSFVGHSVPDHVRDDGSLVLRSGKTIHADRVVAAPRLHGRSVRRLPSDRAGFVPTDALGRVHGLEHVYAAGDVTTFPLKQGGIAAQQADRIAQSILISAGAPVTERRIPRVLQARLIGGEEQLFLRAELDELGRATSATLTRSASEEAAVGTKVLARYLAPYLEQIGSTAAVRN